MYKKLTGFTVLLALVAVVLTTYVRLVGAEMACSDWPACYGQVFFLEESTSAAVVDIAKASLELGQRYVFAGLSLSVLVLALLACWQKGIRVAAISTSTLALLLLALQGFCAFWLVKSNAMPAIALGKTILQMAVAWFLYGLYLRSTTRQLTVKLISGNVLLAGFAMLVVLLQIIFGVWLSVNNGAFACAGFPQCNGQWLPAADYQTALNFVSGLMTGYSGILSYDAQVAVSVLHRCMAVLSFIVLSVLLFKATTVTAPKPLKTSGVVLGVVLFAQLLIAILGVKMAMPMWVLLSHQALSVLLMLPLIAISFYSRYALDSAVQPVTDVASTEVLSEVDYVEPEPESLYLRLKSQLKRTRSGLGGLLSSLPLGQKEINRDLLEEIEASLIMADIGINVSNDIIQQLTQRLERNQLADGAVLSAALKEELLNILKPCSAPLVIPEQDNPFVILVVGVNGAGKTTTIGKLAKRLQVQGHSVMLAAGDTFRAAAVEQLQTWGERNNIPVVAQHTGADSASVIYDALQSAQAKGIDVLIADTAGRLHTKSNLMDELKKVKRIMGKLDETAPHEVLLVLDAGTGQNALSQAKIFNETVELTGLVLTKLDGTAKGGVIFALAKQLGLPIRYIGIGEGIDDLQNFDAELFVEALCVSD
jgi:fused signal recognition particle receptor